MKKAELLAPAKDLTVGIAAINNGADAVYIGAPAFGARKAAANSLEDIRTLVDYAHRYYCRVFVTFNTILYDEELPEAEKLIHQLYQIGVDALIIQDMGILRMDLPPVALHASTQMHNYDLKRIRFLDRIGFDRIVLARELSLEQIRKIRQEVKAELEVFIHGALCVSLSGQCYLSQYMFGRSANRGACAQPCRMKWSVKDREGKVLVKDKYVLSLKDLNLSASLKDLIDAGVDSFKIEGRLKDENYVANVTQYYSSLFDAFSDIERIGSGKSVAAFVPEPERSFNRGTSGYFLQGRQRGMVNMDTPKSTGKKIGQVKKVEGNRLEITAVEEVHNGDGLCYIEQGELRGLRVNRVEGNFVFCKEKVNVRPGTVLYRNYDHQFTVLLEKEPAIRKITIDIRATESEGHLILQACDENGIQAECRTAETFELAANPLQRQRLEQQLAKCGDTEFRCEKVTYSGEKILFVPAAAANQARRCLLENLRVARAEQRPVLPPTRFVQGTGEIAVADWHYNVVNRKAEELYRICGAQQVEWGFEKQPGGAGRDLMRTRYCLLHEMGWCKKQGKAAGLKFPLYLYNDKHTFQLEFDCQTCFMKILSL